MESTAIADATEELPATGTWYVDAAHSSVNFVTRHMMSKVRGSFRVFGGTIEIAEESHGAVVSAEIDAASIDTGQQQRDGHLRSPDFLDADSFPQLTFTSTDITRDDDGWHMRGDLTIRDVTRPVKLEVELLGLADNPMGGGKRVGFSARTQINREDFGLTWNQVLESGSLLVGKKVDIELDIAAVDTPPQH